MIEDSSTLQMDGALCKLLGKTPEEIYQLEENELLSYESVDELKETLLSTKDYVVAIIDIINKLDDKINSYKKKYCPENLKEKIENQKLYYIKLLLLCLMK